MACNDDFIYASKLCNSLANNVMQLSKRATMAFNVVAKGMKSAALSSCSNAL